MSSILPTNAPPQRITNNAQSRENNSPPNSAGSVTGEHRFDAYHGNGVAELGPLPDDHPSENGTSPNRLRKWFNKWIIAPICYFMHFVVWIVVKSDHISKFSRWTLSKLGVSLKSIDAMGDKVITLFEIERRIFYFVSSLFALYIAVHSMKKSYDVVHAKWKRAALTPDEEAITKIKLLSNQDQNCCEAQTALGENLIEFYRNGQSQHLPEVQLQQPDTVSWVKGVPLETLKAIIIQDVATQCFYDRYGLKQAPPNYIVPSVISARKKYFDAMKPQYAAFYDKLDANATTGFRTNEYADQNEYSRWYVWHDFLVEVLEEWGPNVIISLLGIFTTTYSVSACVLALEEWVKRP
ncbi:hypothetical protein JCM33374_g6308 [Metschnikowia sp. JCM 33374]|nr:hypothetical protein JCM33374_g6308 [Metschnikowia sp. JCM 33374]